MILLLETICFRKVNSFKLRVLFILCLIGLSGILKANSYNRGIEFNGSSREKLNIGTSVDILTDKTNTYSIEDVSKSSSFISSRNFVPNLGVTNYSHWIKFKIKNLTDEKLLLELAQPALDVVELYSVNSKGQVNKIEYGERFDFNSREYLHPHYVFELDIAKGTTSLFYLKLKSGQQIQVPLTLGTNSSIFKVLHDKDILFGIYCGVILVMVLYNFFIFLTLRESIYLIYVIYTIFVGILQASLEGYTFQYLWPDNPWFANQSVHLLSAVSAILAMVFFKMFLNTAKNAPRFDKGLWIFITIYILSMVLSVTGEFNISYLIVQLNGMLTALYLLIIAIIMLNRGFRQAKFFLIAWSTFLLGVCTFVLKDLEILPSNLITNYMMQTGSALEVMFLSFALADRINILKKEKEDSQKEAFEALEENDRLLKAQNVMLDQKVKERTQELQQSNSNLEDALFELKEAQAQLVNAEKMASLGQLTAGVAHEINNPINFVSSSVKPLKRDVQDLIGLLEAYKELNISNFKEKSEEIKAFMEEIDIEYIKEEIDSLLKGIEDGASRTSEIVIGLKTFSRIDEADLKTVDLNEGLDSTLIILNSEIRDRITITKDYGQIPKVECYAGKINQVFMNILNNAVFAVNKKAGAKGEISIKTMKENTNVIIRIKDNGTGIPAEVRTKIFDPFFTTKDVGEGTGLGLSIVYNIIETHKGNIRVESEEGKGSEFIITIPTVQSR